MRKIRGVLAVLGVVAIAGIAAPRVTAPAALGQDGGIGDRIKALLDRDYLEGVVSILADERASEELTGDAGMARELMSALADGAGKAAGNDKKNGRKLADMVVPLADEVVEGDDTSADAHWARALALVTRGRILRAIDAETDAQPWVDAAASLATAREHDDTDDTTISRSVEFLLEGAPLAADGGEALRTRAKTLADEGLTRSPDSPPLLMAWCDVRIALAALTKKKNDAKTWISECIDRLEPLMESSSGKQKTDYTDRHNQAVTVNIEKKLGVRAKYVMSHHTIAREIEFDVPVGSRWLVSEDGATTRVFQWGPGKVLYRAISFDSYSWSTEWQFGEAGAAGGDNLKGIAKCNLEVLLADFTKVKKKRLAKGSLGKGTPNGQVIDIVGTRSGKTYGRTRAYYWKAEESMTTYEVLIHEYVPFDDLGAETKAFADSLKEQKR